MTAGTEELAGSSQREALLLVVQSRVISPETIQTNNKKNSTGGIYISAHTHYYIGNNNQQKEFIKLRVELGMGKGGDREPGRG